MELVASMSRHSARIKLISFVLIVLGLIFLASALPLERGIESLKAWVQDLGIRGPLVLGVVYITSALLFVPGSILTISSGAVFGLLWGTITVSVASTTAAALAFLIARYLARTQVQEQVRKYPKFAAVDRAIGLGGWRFVFLLRLSPAFPYSVSNYLYGLTPVRFWPFILASWIAMLPGTFMYVYFGHIGLSLSDASRSSTSRILLVIGLMATVVVTVYITKLARRAIGEQTDFEEGADEVEEAGWPEGEVETAKQVEASQRLSFGALIAPLLALLVVAAAAGSTIKRDALRAMFGPPVVALAEKYQPNPGGPTFDHSGFDVLLKKYVDPNGWVNYQELRKDNEQLDQYIDTVANAPFEELGRNEKLALLINAYNAFTLRLVLDYYPIASIKDIPKKKRWDDARWRIGSHIWSLNQIEHEQIRAKFKEPRVHFALVCASVSCSTLRNEVYRADRIDAQLEEQARYVHTHDRWFRFDEPGKNVHLTMLYSWYRQDFGHDSVLEFVALYVPSLKRTLDAGSKPSIRWLKYDWSLNSKENVQ